MWDAIVVGAGPGGSIAAHQLARRNRSVLLLEKESLPRYKPCGGGLPPHVISLLEDIEIDVDPYVENVADQVKFLFNFEDAVISDLEDAPVTMVNRAEFDHGLVKQAVAAGARFRDDAPVKRVETEENSVRVVLQDGDTLESRFLVGADGAGSRVARSVGLMDERSQGVALDAEVRVDRETFEREQRYATFNINFVNRGYGWIFPKNRYLGMGVGGYDSEPSYPQLIRDYVSLSLPDSTIEEMEIYGHPLPFFDRERSVTEGTVGLVGDAANMVDALSGEGIFYAMKAGRQIAESIDENLNRERLDLDNYQRRVDQGIARELTWSRRLSKLFFRFPRKCYEHGVKDPFIVNYVKQVVVSESGYDAIYRDFWKEVKKRMSQKLLRSIGFG